MSFVYPNPLKLVGTPCVGTKECAALAQNLVPGLDHAFSWKRGAKVKGNNSLPQGTVIAIFDTNGRYIGTHVHAHQGGVAHTALYVRQSSVGIEVVHQYRAAACIKGTLIRFGAVRVPGHHSGVSASGVLPEDDADNYYVVEK